MCEDGSALRTFTPGKTVQLVVKAEHSKFDIYVNGVKFAGFNYRVQKPDNVTHVRIGGELSFIIHFGIT